VDTLHRLPFDSVKTPYDWEEHRLAIFSHDDRSWLEAICHRIAQLPTDVGSYFEARTIAVEAIYKIARTVEHRECEEKILELAVLCATGLHVLVSSNSLEKTSWSQVNRFLERVQAIISANRAQDQSWSLLSQWWNDPERANQTLDVIHLDVQSHISESHFQSSTPSASAGLREAGNEPKQQTHQKHSPSPEPCRTLPGASSSKTTLVDSGNYEAYRRWRNIKVPFTEVTEPADKKNRADWGTAITVSGITFRSTGHVTKREAQNAAALECLKAIMGDESGLSAALTGAPQRLNSQLGAGTSRLTGWQC